MRAGSWRVYTTDRITPGHLPPCLLRTYVWPLTVWVFLVSGSISDKEKHHQISHTTFYIYFAFVIITVSTTRVDFVCLG